MPSQFFVFIDTSIYKKNGFVVDRTLFKTLRSLCRSEKVQLISTDITDNEIESNIYGSINEFKTELKKIVSKHKVIQAIEGENYSNFIKSKVAEEAAKDIKRRIDIYLEECNVQVINASDQTGKDIFNDYFLKRPPFGEGKKKNEFPDAFVLSSLKSWSSSSGNDIVTVSTDKDFKKFCDSYDKFTYFSSLYEFINFALSNENNMVSVVHDIIEQNKNSIVEKIEGEIENMGFYIGDADGEVYFKNLLNLSFIDISVIDIEDNTADIHCIAETTLSFDADYWDPDSWFSVRDEGVKEVYYHHRIEGQVQKDFTIEVEFTINFNAEKFKLINIENVVVNSGSDFEYSHYDFDEYY